MSTLFPLKFRGLNEGDDPKALPPGTMRVAINCAMDKAARIVKRDGTAKLTKAILTGGNVASALRLATRGDELLLTDGTTLYSYSPQLSQWVPCGAVPECGLTWQTLAAPIDGVMASDINITSDGKIVHAWVTGDPTKAYAVGGTAVGGELCIQVIDPTTGGRIAIASNESVWRSTNMAVFYPRVLVNGTDWIVVYNRTGGSNTTAKVEFVDSSFATHNLVADGRSTTHNYVAFDACMIGSDVVIGYEKNAVNCMVLASFSFAGVAIANGSVSETNGETTAVSLAGRSGETLFVAFSSRGSAGATSKVRVAFADPSTLVQSGSTADIDTTANTYVHNVGVERLTANSCVVAYSVRTATAGTTYTTGAAVTKVVDTSGTITAERTTHNALATSAPFVIGSTPYIILSDCAFSAATAALDTTQNPFLGVGVASYLAAIETTTLSTSHRPHRLVAQLDLQIGGEWTWGALSRVHAKAGSTTEYLAVMPYQAEAATKPLGWLQGMRLTTILTGASLPVDAFRGVEVGPEVHLCGGKKTTYDGRRTFDFGFPRTSAIALSYTTTSNAGAMAAGNYLYATVPVFQSAAGIRHRGPSSPSIRFTVVANGNVVLNYIPQTLGWKGTSDSDGKTEPMRVEMELYRTVANGSNLHKLTLAPSDNVSINDPTTGTDAVNDISADSSISSVALQTLASQAIIYSALAKDDYSPPASTTHAMHRHRVFAIDGSKRLLWYTKDFTEDETVAAAYHPDEVIPFAEDMEAVGSLDERLVVFSATTPYLVDGDGPAPDGAGSTYSPVKIQSDVGCSNPRSLVTLPFGLGFQSSRGLELLDRGLNVQWLGKVAEDTLATYPTITSAVLVPAKHEVRWTCNKADKSAGVVLVWDYVNKAWFTRTYTDAADTGATSVAIADAVLWQGVWTFVTFGGQVYTEDSSTHLDNGNTWVGRDIQLAPISPMNNLAWHRVKSAAVLGTNLTNHDLEISVARDYRTSWDQTETFLSNSNACAVGPLQRARVILKYPKCEAVTIRLRDLTPSANGANTVGNGAGPIWEALALQVGVKSGFPRGTADETK